MGKDRLKLTCFSAGEKAAHMKWRPDGALWVVVVDNGTHRGEHVGTDRRMAKRS